MGSIGSRRIRTLRLFGQNTVIARRQNAVTLKNPATLPPWKVKT